MKKDEKIMLQHAVNGKFGNETNLSEDINLGVKINNDKKEIILTDIEDASSILNVLRLYEDYLVIVVSNGSATTFGTAKEMIEKLNLKVVAIHILEKDFASVKGFLDSLQAKYFFENSTRTVQDIEDGINKFI